MPNYSEFFLQAEVRPAINLAAVPCFERSIVTGQFVPCATAPVVNLEELCALDGVPCYFDTDFRPGEGAEIAPRPATEITPDTQLLAAGYDELGLEEVETIELGYSGDRSATGSSSPSTRTAARTRTSSPTCCLSSAPRSAA